MTEIAVRDTDSWSAMLPAVGDLATKIANTQFVPKALRGKPAETAACILTGREIGLGPMESLAKIHVVDGRPGLSAELMRSLVLRAGHRIRFTELTDKAVTIEGARAGTDDLTSVRWTMADAQRIGVADKPTWKQYPRQMLAARATSELCRLLFPDALGGVAATVEELDDETTPMPTVKVGRAERPTKVQRTLPAEPEPSLDEPAVDTETGEIVDAEVVEDTEPEPPLDEPEAEPVVAEPLPLEPKGPPITQQQQAKMRVLLQANNIRERDDILAFVSEVIGRAVESSKQLTRDEAGQVIDLLESMAPEESE